MASLWRNWRVSISRSARSKAVREPAIPLKSGPVSNSLRWLRDRSDVPVIFITARREEVDRVGGLELGADDYVVKPFGVKELLARVRALLRRNRRETPPKDLSPIVFGRVRVDPRTYEGRRGNTAFSLSGRELELLRYLVERDGEVASRFDLLDAVWGIKYEGTTRTLDQHIAKLRRKVEEDPADPRHILTVHGVGYRFRSK